GRADGAIRDGHFVLLAGAVIRNRQRVSHRPGRRPRSRSRAGLPVDRGCGRFPTPTALDPAPGSAGCRTGATWGQPDAYGTARTAQVEPFDLLFYPADLRRMLRATPAGGGLRPPRCVTRTDGKG